MIVRSTMMGGTKAFTAIELLISILIILLLMGMVIGLPTSDKKHAAVRAAAEELAATLRAARAIAIGQSIVCGVAFHVQNGPGTTGLVLNNWSGGHWYRIIGAQTPPDAFPANMVMHSHPVPNYVDRSLGGLGNVSQYLASVEESWLSEPHVLSARRVRFLSLSDQDSGSGGWASAGRIPATYPRPWYGWWSGGTLYAWGGYDGSKPLASRSVDQGGRLCSGFYYEGNDGTVSGCRNPIDRYTTNTGVTGSVPVRQILKAGEPRPLINANWLDYVISFYPDGTVEELSEPMAARSSSYRLRGTVNEGYRQGGTGDGDLGGYSAMRGELPPMQNYWRHTGKWAVTLAPDAEQDTDAFPTAKAALASIWPMYRVTVNRLGDVQVVQVSPGQPDGLVFDTTSITSWSSLAQVKNHYQGFIATNIDGSLRTDAGGRLYRPVDAFLTEQILASRQWWATW